MVFRCIPPQWLKDQGQYWPIEADLSHQEMMLLNQEGYNVYYFPNYPRSLPDSVNINGIHIDHFEWVFVDFDLKTNTYENKEHFIEEIFAKSDLPPTKIIDSGNGVHVYWKVSDLDAIGFLRLQRRLMRFFNTDEAVGKICQLMRFPGTINNKDKDEPKLCETIFTEEGKSFFTQEEISKALPPISQADEAYCQAHYNKTYNIGEMLEIDDALPAKFGELLRDNKEVKEIFQGNTDDRSKSDYRLAHLMLSAGMTKQEGLSVLINCQKALGRSMVHRVSYADGIASKVWTEAPIVAIEPISRSVKDILSLNGGKNLQGIRFPCYRYLDATDCGFRIGHVAGLVAGSGVGKTSMALNMFLGFVKSNPDYVHFFVPLEQPVNEIADRWRKMVDSDPFLSEKVHLISNYADDGSFRHLSLDEIKEYILKFKTDTGLKVGAVVIDHIAALKMKTGEGENQRIMDICHSMKNFALETQTFLVMQSQAPREKAGIGDLELNKDAAYGSVLFESYCDYLITIWQPVKRCYAEGAPLVTAFKFCKIRHKNVKKDKIQEDVRYTLIFDPDTEHFRMLTQVDEESFNYFVKKATNIRKEDKKTSLIEYTTITWTKDENGTAQDNQDSQGA